MIHLNRDHPDYNTDMEVLISLPLEPCMSFVMDLAIDMGTPHRLQAPIHEALTRLEKKYAILRKEIPDDKNPSTKHRAACIEQCGWAEAQRDGQAYWDKVNEHTPGSHPAPTLADPEPAAAQPSAAGRPGA